MRCAPAIEPTSTCEPSCAARAGSGASCGSASQHAVPRRGRARWFARAHRYAERGNHGVSEEAVARRCVPAVRACSYMGNPSPAIHELTLDGATAHRIVLGAWYEQGAVCLGPRGLPARGSGFLGSGVKPQQILGRVISSASAAEKAASRSASAAGKAPPCSAQRRYNCAWPIRPARVRHRRVQGWRQPFGQQLEDAHRSVLRSMPQLSSRSMRRCGSRAAISARSEPALARRAQPPEGYPQVALQTRNLLECRNSSPPAARSARFCCSNSG